MRGLGFLLRLALLVALVAWLAESPGSVNIVWRGAVVETSVAFLLLVLALMLYGVLLGHRLWRSVMDVPRFWTLKNALASQKGGLEALSKGFIALAAGQAARAGDQAARARKLLGETPMTQLLMAQAADLSGNDRAARALFLTMSRRTETALLGARGLIALALRAGDYDEAAHQALHFETQEGQAIPWFSLVRFESLARSGQWGEAALCLDKARKGRVLSQKAADEQEAALLLGLAKDALREAQPREALTFAEKAQKLRPDWIPSVLVASEALIASGHERAALRILGRAWKARPHPDLLPLTLWALGMLKPLEAFRAVERLVRPGVEAFDVRMALADLALKADLWGEARRHLMALEKAGRARASTYRALARLEQRVGTNERASALWFARAATAPTDALWLCEACGASHDSWGALCAHCGAFNRISWGVIGQGRAFDTTPALSFLPSLLTARS